MLNGTQWPYDEEGGIKRILPCFVGKRYQSSFIPLLIDQCLPMTFAPAFLFVLCAVLEAESLISGRSYHLAIHTVLNGRNVYCFASSRPDLNCNKQCNSLVIIQAPY